MARPTTPQPFHHHPSTREDRATLGVIASYLHDLTPHEQSLPLDDDALAVEAFDSPEARAA